MYHSVGGAGTTKNTAGNRVMSQSSTSSLTDKGPVQKSAYTENSSPFHFIQSSYRLALVHL